MNEELSELVGLFIGDGCMSKYSRKNRPNRTSIILFTGGWKKDSQYYHVVIRGILRRYFNLKAKVYHRKDDDTVRVKIYDKHFIAFFRNLGFNFGKKSETVFIPKEILENRSFSLACLRGIFNADGCVYKRYQKNMGNTLKFIVIIK